MALTNQPLCVILTICEQPPLVCHGPQLPCMHQLELPLLQVSFVPNTAPWSNLSPTELPKDVRFSYVLILSIRPQANVHTMQVPLVRGPLRLTPLSTCFNFHANIIVVWRSECQGSSYVKTLSIFGILSNLLQVGTQYSFIHFLWK